MSAVTEVEEKTYSADTARHTLWHGLVPIVSLPHDLWRHRYLVQNFFRRELLGRFRGSFLGVFWVLVHPIFLFAIYYFVFGIMFGNQKAGVPPDPNYALFLFSGVLAFTAMNEGLTRSCTTVVDNGNLVKKVAFPCQLLPVHLILVAMLVYAVGAVVCLVAGMAYGVLHPGWNLLWLPIVLCVQFVFTYGLGLLLANLQVFSRDTSHLWGIVGTAWMFLSPVFWFPAMLEKFGSGLEIMLVCNPAYPLLQAHRIALGAQDGVINGMTVEFGSITTHLGVASLWALLFLFLGYAVFMSRRHKFADLV